MKLQLKHKRLILGQILSSVALIAFMGFSGQVFAASQQTYTQEPASCPIGQTLQTDTTNPTCCPGYSKTANGTACLVNKYINPAIQLLSALVGMIVVIAVIVGSIEYITSGGDPQRTTSGRKHISNALLGLFAYILLLALFEFLIPGGKLNG